MSKRNKTSNVATTPSTIVQSNENNARVDSLLKTLHDTQHSTTMSKIDIANACKKIRRALRALNHFGGTRTRSSIYFDAQRNTIDNEKIALRAKRLMQRVTPSTIVQS